ncbi:MAG: hypothetical protein LBE34_12980 [Flavobacteriaceae bacterium]|jgi:uncharacterized protein involved in cysteine biosynthesis|nr:hypothetical protein [Flavobacteriaceae bacterium]
MKIKIIIMAILFFSLIGLGLKYLDLCVSEKYETQLEGLNPTEKQIKDAEDLKRKIERDKKNALAIIAVSLLAIYPASLIKK